MTDDIKPQIDTDTLHTLIVAELLLSPEYSRTWIKDFAIDSDIELTDAQLDAVDGAVTRTLDQLAIPFVESLPEAQRAVYRSVLEKRAQAAYPLGEGHGADLKL